VTQLKRVRGSGGQDEPMYVHAPNMTELWDKLNKSLLWARKDQLAYYSSIDTMVGDGIGLADTAEFNIDIGKELWVTPSRWSTLIRQYVDPDRLFKWLEDVKGISTYNRGISAMDMQSVKHQVVESNARANRRKHGGCMRMVTYRAFPQPTVTLYSRTSYLGYIGGLDMLLAHKLIAMAADMIGDGLSVEDFQFRWHCEVWQFHGFKSMSYLFASGQDKFMRVREWPVGLKIRHPVDGHIYKLPELDELPTWKLVRNWWKRLHGQDLDGKTYNEMRYGAEKRIRRRYHAQQGVDQTPFLTKEKAYDPLSTPMEEITLDRMLYKTPESRAVVRKMKREKSEALVKALFEGEDDWVVKIGRKRRAKEDVLEVDPRFLALVEEA
jgi:hypothetical protein